MKVRSRLSFTTKRLVQALTVAMVCKPLISKCPPSHKVVSVQYDGGDHLKSTNHRKVF